MLNKLILLEGLARCIEISVAEISEKSKQLPVMPDKYLSYVNSIVKICSLLGIVRQEIEPEALDLGKYVDEKYGSTKEGSDKK